MFVNFELKSDQVTQASGARNMTQIISALTEKLTLPISRAPSDQKRGVLPDFDDVFKLPAELAILRPNGFGGARVTKKSAIY